MSETLDRIIQQDGYDVHFIHTKKFKTIHLSLKFMAKLTRENVTKRALLPYVLQQGTKNFPTAIKLRQHLDELYAPYWQLIAVKKAKIIF